MQLLQYQLVALAVAVGHLAVWASLCTASECEEPASRVWGQDASTGYVCVVLGAPLGMIMVVHSVST